VSALECIEREPGRALTSLGTPGRPREAKHQTEMKMKIREISQQLENVGTDREATTASPRKARALSATELDQVSGGGGRGGLSGDVHK